MSGIALKPNAYEFKIAPHKQKSIVKKKLGQEDRPDLANGALSTMVNPALPIKLYNEVFFFFFFYSEIWDGSPQLLIV